MSGQKGYMIISLDLELMWGVRDHHTNGTYGDAVLKVRDVIPRLLELFQKNQIHATWAAVGYLLAENRDDLENFFPSEKPTYRQQELSNYTHMEQVGQNEEMDPYSFAPSLIKLIRQYPHQELGTHTFSHYYCNEEGQTISQFSDDLHSARRIQYEKTGKYPVSIVYPRNQYNPEYTAVLRDNGIRCYRGHEKKRIYMPPQNLQWKRMLRLVDAYWNITGHKTYTLNELREEEIANLRASLFFRPYFPRLRIFEKQKLRRIKHQMKYAASHGKVFHMWWHPHNFGRNTEENFAQLAELIAYYHELNVKYGFRSVNMGELSLEVIK